MIRIRCTFPAESHISLAPDLRPYAGCVFKRGPLATWRAAVFSGERLSREEGSFALVQIRDRLFVFFRSGNAGNPEGRWVLIRDVTEAGALDLPAAAMAVARDRVTRDRHTDALRRALIDEFRTAEAS